MDKILIELYVPAIGEKFDLFVPDFLKIRTLRHLLSEAVKELSDNRYASSGEEILCDYIAFVIFSEDKCLKDYKVQNGSKLMLC